MHGELQVPVAMLLAFLVTLARVAGIFIFLPLPGLKAGVELARVVLAVTITIALFPIWPQVGTQISAGQAAVWMISEAGLGIGIGLAVSFVLEAAGVAAQILGLQAGYAFASTIDPTTQADSGILVILAQLAAGLVFFALGLDREVLRIFAFSLEASPPGSFVMSRGAAEHLVAAAGSMFSTGLRLAFPVVAVLVMVDISLALLGRINSQLQLLTIAFPIKMLVALSILGFVLTLLPTLMRMDSETAFGAARGLFAH